MNEVSGSGRLVAELARDAQDVLACQRLRWQVFAGELGARIDGGPLQADCDRFDAYADHLLVRDRDSGRVVACARLLDRSAAMRAGGFYSALEFDISAILALPGRLLELGRTCVDPDWRDGRAIAELWRGIARQIVRRRAEYLFGCASVDLGGGWAQATAIARHVLSGHAASPGWRVRPYRPVPKREDPAPGPVAMPALLRAYLSLGAQVCGEPAWDPDFHCIDLFVLLPIAQMHPRYRRRFLGAGHGAAAAAGYR